MLEELSARGITSRMIADVNGLDMHVLEAGRPGDPLLLLLHGFPELAFSWRKIMAPLAAEGFHVVAPDQRGYGQTTGWTGGYDVDLAEYGMPNLSEDIAALSRRLGAERFFLVGHDFGSPVAAWTSLIHPELVRAVALMSAPFAGAPGIGAGAPPEMHDDLLSLDPPRKHYQWWYGDRAAEEDFLSHPAGFDAVFRAYYHCKSADWSANAPHPLPDWSGTSLAVMPRYYIMNADEGMGDTAMSMAPAPRHDCAWLTDHEMQVYTSAFRTGGLQAPLNWYRRSTSADGAAALGGYSGRQIEAPICFIAGAQDWGVWQAPGALQSMEARAVKDWRGRTLIEGAGHWVQQEKPEETAAAIISFLRDAA